MFEIKYQPFNTHTCTWKRIRLLLVDNCYDRYIRNQYVKYINDNKVTHIISQDDDLSYLADCPNIEFIACSPESNHLDTLYSLRNLRGLSFWTNDNSFDFSKLSPTLLFLRTKYESENKSWLNNSTISELSLIEYETENLLWLSKLKNKITLKTFEIYVSYRKFCALNGLKELVNLEGLILDYCRQLSDIVEITKLPNLKTLQFFDIPRVKDLPLDCLKTLEELYLIDMESTRTHSLDSLSFLKSMPKLHTFWSNYNILSGDLNLLLRLKDVDTFPDRKHYNLKNSDLPHIVR